jgi:dipeptidyl aminopeptidase/acylaminoacyl peptidase
VVHDRPLVLPGGRFLLFSSLTFDPGAERIEAVSIDSGQRSVVVERATTPLWSPTGHLLFARDGAVLAVPFDPATAKTRGTAVPIMRRGTVDSLVSGDLGVWLTSAGTLAYLPAGFIDERPVSVARDGAAMTLDLPSAGYAFPRISPDGRRLLLASGAKAIEVLDLKSNRRSLLTSSAFGTRFPIWSADGSRVVFRRFNLPFSVAADGATDPVPLPAAISNDFPSSAGPDSDSVLVVRSGDVYLMSISGAFAPKPLISTAAIEGGAQLSPDGRWLMYQSDASERAEIYVRNYPARDRQWTVSEGGGVQARWNRDSREIYYATGRASSRCRWTPLAPSRPSANPRLSSRTSTNSVRAGASRTTT